MPAFLCFVCASHLPHFPRLCLNPGFKHVAPVSAITGFTNKRRAVLLPGLPAWKVASGLVPEMSRFLRFRLGRIGSWYLFSLRSCEIQEDGCIANNAFLEYADANSCLIEIEHGRRGRKS